MLKMNKYNRYSWTNKKDELLVKLYPIEDWDTLLEVFKPLKKDTIVHRAKKLNVTRRKIYTEEQIEFLKENYNTMSIKELSEKLGKTEPSIMTKANKLGLVKMEKWSEEDIQNLIKIYPYYTNEELLKFFPNRSLVGISSMATMKLNLYKDEKYLSEKYYKNENERMLKELVDYSIELGRTPTSDEVQENKRLSGIASYYRNFGSYSNACRDAGLEINVSLFGKSIHHVSKNGDVCLSSKELEITNILIDNNISYKKELLYKDILKDEYLPSIRTDWYINDEIIVEYFGMAEKEYYRKRMNEKIDLCKVNELPLIELYPNDIKHNYKGLVNKFSEYGIDLVI